MSLDNDRLYRVSLDPIKNTVQISCIGMDRVDNSLNDTYLSVDDLPKWVQERIALLMMTDPNPPNSEVEGVGHRVSKYTFWISNKEGWEMNYCIACYDDTEYSWTLANHGYPDGKKFSDVVNPAHHAKLKIMDIHLIFPHLKENVFYQKVQTRKEMNIYTILLHVIQLLMQIME